jgi:GT2 family glycosyltransferase
MEDLDVLRAKIVASTSDRSGRIAIIIKTINRKHLLFPTINSILTYCDVPFRLYVGDDGNIDREQQEIYELLKKSGHFVRVYDQPIAFTAGLNDLFRATTDERFVLRMDDDFRFCKQTRVSVLRRLLELVPSLGAVGGAERQFSLAKGTAIVTLRQGFLARFGGTTYRVRAAPSELHYTKIGDYRLAVVNHTTNFLLIRRSVCESVGWNEDLWASGEHLDFSLRLARAGWLIGFTPDCWHEHHDDGIPPSEYTGRDREPDIIARKQLLSREFGIRSLGSVRLAALIEKDRPKTAVFLAHSISRLKRRAAVALALIAKLCHIDSWPPDAWPPLV